MERLAGAWMGEVEGTLSLVLIMPICGTKPNSGSRRRDGKYFQMGVARAGSPTITWLRADT